MINERIFGAPIPRKVQEKLEDRQILAERTSIGVNSSIQAVFPNSNGAAQADIHSRTPFVRMWTGLRLIDPAVMFDTQTGGSFDSLEITTDELSRLGIQNNGEVDLELASEFLSKIKQLPQNKKGQYKYNSSNHLIGDPRLVKLAGQVVDDDGVLKNNTRDGKDRFYIVYNLDRDQMDYAREIYVVGDHNYLENYGEIEYSETRQTNSPFTGRFSGGAIPVGAIADAKEIAAFEPGSNPGFNLFPAQSEKNPLLKPLAGITSVTSETQGSLGVIKKTTISFTVHNFYDYDRIFNKYFLKPGATIFVDFGWSSIKKLYRPEELIGETIETDGLEPVPGGVIKNETQLFDVQSKLYDENNGIVTIEQGDLEVLQGIVTDYSSKILMNGSVECSVTLTSANSALVNFKTDKITNARIHSILRDGILLAGLYPTIDDAGDVIQQPAQCTHPNTVMVNGKYTVFDPDEMIAYGSGPFRIHRNQQDCEDPTKQEDTTGGPVGFWKSFGSAGPLDNDLKELLSFPNHNSSPDTIAAYQSNLRKFAQMQLSTTGPAPVGNSIRTGIFVDNLNAENVYMSWGLFEDLIMNSEFGHGKNLSDINNKKDFQVRMDSSTTFTTFSNDLLEKQRVLLSITEEPPKILYPEWWSIADPDIDMTAGGGSYNYQQDKYPKLDYNERYRADLENGDIGDLFEESELVQEDKNLKRIPLREVFINVDVLMEAFRQNNSVMKVINSILKTLNEACDGVFQWKMVTGNTDSQFKIVDLYYLSIIEEIQKKVGTTDPTKGFNVIDPADNPLFTFKIMNPKSIVVDYNLEFNLPQGSIGSMYAIQGMSHDTSVISISDEIDDVMGLTSLDTDSNMIIYEPDNGKYRIEKLQNQAGDSDNFNVYETMEDILSSDTFNIKGVVTNNRLSAPLTVTGSDPTSTGGGTTTTTGGTKKELTFEEIIKVNDDRLKTLGFVVTPTFSEYFTQKIRGNVVETDRPNLLPYTLSLKLYGIASIVPGDTFKVDYLPQKHFNHTFLQTTKVKQDIDSTGWYTTLETQYRLLPNAKQTSIKGRGLNRVRLSAGALKKLPLFKSGAPEWLKLLNQHMTDIRVSSPSTSPFDFILDFKTTNMDNFIATLDANDWWWWDKAHPNIVSGDGGIGLVTNQPYQKNNVPTLWTPIIGSDLNVLTSTKDYEYGPTENGWEKYEDGDVLAAPFAAVSSGTTGGPGANFLGFRFVFYPVPIDITQSNHEFRMIYLDGRFMFFDKKHPNYQKIFNFFDNFNVQTWDPNDGSLQQANFVLRNYNVGSTFNIGSSSTTNIFEPI
tara:strand:- start:44 stop:3937 length:3894 start_codon:yes stop_codon:yes gene_type:complete